MQNVDEGTGLFIRGGDVSETRVLINDIVMIAPYNYETPTGNYTVTVNPFLLDRIFFSSGGFGARYGNILSGVADLRTPLQHRLHEPNPGSQSVQSIVLRRRLDLVLEAIAHPQAQPRLPSAHELRALLQTSGIQ